MQNEKNDQQEEVTFTEAELMFVRSLEETLNQALGDGDNVTSIWSRLKPEQRARLADDYLARLQEDNGSSAEVKLPRNAGFPSSESLENFMEDLASGFSPPRPEPPSPDHRSSAQAPRADHPGDHDRAAGADNPYRPPRGYPADFNPLAGFPGLEPSRTAPRPEDIIANALPGFGGAGNVNPLDVLRGWMPPGTEPTPQSPPAPGMPPAPGEPAEPQTGYRQDEQGRTQPAPDPAAQPATGPAAPNFWPLWIDQQDNLLKQCLKLMSGNMDDAQDALSEAMVKASTKFEDSMDEIRNHRAWLSRIVHNACIDLHRQNRRKAEYKEETHGNSTADTPASPMTAPVIPSPEESYLTGERLDQLDEALNAMQESLRKPLLMRCVQDRSYDEIARALGLSNCAVRKRVQLAREQLRSAGIK